MKRNTFIVVLILLIFFVISLLTNILGSIIPDVIDSFTLSVAMAGFLPFAFFVAYGVMSIPAGIMIEKYSEKTVLLVAFFLAFAGALIFGLFPGYVVFMLSLFLIGIGMAMLQVVINPLLRQAGGEESFYFNSVLAQLFFGGASFLSPKLYSYLDKNVHSGNDSLLIRICDSLVPENLKWVSLYWIFAFLAFLMVVIIRFVKFPTVELKDDEKIEMGDAFKNLLGNKFVILFFFAIFAYVGTEQGIANWISKFLQTYHGIDPATGGADIVANFWGLLTVGCLLGLVLLKIFDSRMVLIIFSAGAIISLLFALFGTAAISPHAFAVTGFFASVMWSVIFSLALNSVSSHHGTFAGILCTGIVGGAVVPPIVGMLAEATELRTAMLFLFIPLGYILSIGFWAKPIVTNKTILSKETV